jgi:PAS domain-containing protein
VETLATAVLVVLASVVVLRHNGPLAYLAVPALVWASLRFRQAGAVLGGLVVCAIAVWCTSRGVGPFTGAVVGVELLRVQTFVAVATTTALLVAAIRSERDMAERALSRLAESEQALAEAQKLTQIGSFKWDIDGDRAEWSDELYRILGVSPEAGPAAYRAWRAATHPDDRELLDTSMARARDELSARTFVHRVIRPDGQIRTVECNARVELDEAGEPVRMTGPGRALRHEHA